MKKKCRKVFDVIRRSDKHAIVRSMMAALVVAAIAIVLLYFAALEENKKYSRKMFGQIMLQTRENLDNVIDGGKDAVEMAARTMYEVLGTVDEKSLLKIISENETDIFLGVTAEKSSASINDGLHELSYNSGQGLVLSFHSCGEYLLSCLIDEEKLCSNIDANGFDGRLKYILYDVRSGEIAVNTAREYGFDGSYIGSLKDYRFDDGFSDTSMFSDMDKKKSGYVSLWSENEKYAISYVPVEDESFYLIGIVPEKTLFAGRSAGGRLLAFLLAALAAAGLVFVVIVCKGALKYSSEGSETECRLNIVRKIFLQLSDIPMIRVFLYIRGKDTITVIKDKDGLNKSYDNIAGGFEYMVSGDGLDEENARKLKNAINLTGPGKDMSVSIKTGDGTKLRYFFSLAEVNTKREKAVVCVAKPESDENELQNNDAQAIKRAIEEYSTVCIEIFLERNMWRYVWNAEHGRESVGGMTGMRDNYDASLENELCENIKQADRERFVRALSRLQLLESFRNGNSELAFSYKTALGEGKVVEMRLYRDVENDEIKANLYFRNKQIWMSEENEP